MYLTFYSTGIFFGFGRGNVRHLFLSSSIELTKDSSLLILNSHLLLRDRTATKLMQHKLEASSLLPDPSKTPERVLALWSHSHIFL